MALMATGNSPISDALSGTTAANKANNKRYKQGLDVLKGGYKQGMGFIGDALNSIKNVGQVELGNINVREQKGLADMQQNAIGRGLGNTTIADTMKDLPTRQANDARAGVAEMMARNRSNLQMAQSGQANRRADSIAGYIASKNDVGLDPALLAQLTTAAAGAGGNRTSTVTKGSLSTPSFMSPQIAGGGGGAIGSGGAISGGSVGGGSSGGGYQPSSGGDSAPPPPVSPSVPSNPNIPQAPPVVPPGTPAAPPPALPGTPPPTQNTDPNKPGYISIKWSGCSDPNVGWIQKQIHMC